MSKPIQEQILKSRLTITYRTNITGTVQQERLPFRLLVLGEFAGRSVRRAGLLPDISKRPVRTIKRGTSVDDHLREMVPAWHLPDTEEFRHLRSAIPGNVVFDQMTCAIPIGAIERNESKAYALSGTATFTSTVKENGLCDIGGKIMVGGTLNVDIKDGIATPGEANIILTGQVSGDYQDPATGKIIGLVTGQIHDSTKAAATQLKMAPLGEVEGEEAPSDPKVKTFVITMTAPLPAHAERTVPFTSSDAFTPDALAASIPEVSRLVVIKLLLNELHSMLRNRPELKKQLRSMLPDYGQKAEEVDKKLAPFEGLKKWAEENYPLLSIERKQA